MELYAEDKTEAVAAPEAAANKLEA